jgi:lipopolysaccharide export system permease protein
MECFWIFWQIGVYFSMSLYRYILRAHVGPFLFSLSTLMFLFLLQFVMKFIDQLVGKGLSAWVIIELIALNLSWMLVLAVPMSVLVAVLMAFGDLSARNEITAMKASGVSIYRMMLPVLAAGFLVGVFLTWFNNVVLPESNHRLKALTIDIRHKRPTLSLVDGVFSQDIQGYSILVKKTSQKTNELHGVTIFDYTNPSVSVTITAKEGKISFSPDYRKLIMDLSDGEIHQLDLTNRFAYRRIRFTAHRIAMNVEGFDFERSQASAFSRGDREMGAGAMLAVVDSLGKARAAIEDQMRQRMNKEMADRLSGVPFTRRPGTPASPAGLSAAALAETRILSSQVTTYLFRIESVQKQIDQYWVEIHKKFSIPAACFVFVLVGVPLGIMSRRGGFGAAATISLGFFVLYWACLIGGEKLADRDILEPWVGMWAANVVIGFAGAYLTFRSARETLAINWTWFLRFLPRRWRGETAMPPSAPLS